MKRLTVVPVAMFLIISASAVAQKAAVPDKDKHASAQAQPMEGKPVSISGRIGEDGKTLLVDAWVCTVSNPEILKAQAGERVVVRGYIDPATGAVDILSVKKSSAGTKYVARRDDSAFRR